MTLERLKAAVSNTFAFRTDGPAGHVVLGQLNSAGAAKSGTFGFGDRAPFTFKSTPGTSVAEAQLSLMDALRSTKTPTVNVELTHPDLPRGFTVEAKEGPEGTRTLSHAFTADRHKSVAAAAELVARHAGPLLAGASEFVLKHGDFPNRLASQLTVHLDGSVSATRDGGRVVNDAAFEIARKYGVPVRLGGAQGQRYALPNGTVSVARTRDVARAFADLGVEQIEIRTIKARVFTSEPATLRISGRSAEQARAIARSEGRTVLVEETGQRITGSWSPQKR